MKKHDLGCMCLWQDEVIEIVRLIRQLPDVEVTIESDRNLLTELPADLSQLGPRVSHFAVTAILATFNHRGASMINPLLPGCVGLGPSRKILFTATRQQPRLSARGNVQISPSTW